MAIMKKKILLHRKLANQELLTVLTRIKEILIQTNQALIKEQIILETKTSLNNLKSMGKLGS
jgi:hypothetical protein